MTLPVNEIFETIQGEGFHTGTPAVFVRFQGCPVGCPWCDTKFTWHKDAADQVSIRELSAKRSSGTIAWAAMSAGEIAERVVQYRPWHVVLTGGEPAMHDLSELSTVLVERHRRTVQVETSGTFRVDVHRRAWVTVSPKIDMPGGFKVRRDALRRANEIKMPVGREDDILKLRALLAVNPSAPVYLQPLSLSPKATQLCAAAAIENGWRVSIQTHALAGWR